MSESIQDIANRSVCVGMNQYAITGAEDRKNVLVSGGAGDCIIVIMWNHSQRRAFICHVDRSTDVENLFKVTEPYIWAGNSSDEFELILASQCFKLTGVKSAENFAGLNYQDQGNYKRIMQSKAKSKYNIISERTVTDPNAMVDLLQGVRAFGNKAKSVAKAGLVDFELNKQSEQLLPPKCVYNAYGKTTFSGF